MSLKALIIFALTSTMFLWVAWSSGQSRQTAEMYLEIGTLSEIVLPEPYTTVQIPVQIVELRDVAGRNKTVITLHPIISDRSKTNIRIYTQNHDINIKLMLNWPRTTPTQTLDLQRPRVWTDRVALASSFMARAA